MTTGIDAAMMDHHRIETEGLVERYVAGRLRPQLREDFEAHFVDCASCLEQIEEAERLRAGLAGVARTEATPPVPVVSLAAYRQRITTWALAAGLAVAGLSALLMQRQLREVQGQLVVARSEAAAAVQRGAKAGEALLEAQASRSQLLDQVAQLGVPRLAPVFALGLSRGAAPTRILTIPRHSQWVVLSLEAGGDPEYRAVLRSATGQVLWEEQRLAPSGDGLAVTLLSDLLPPGDYVIGVTSTAGRGRGEETRFAFRTVLAR